MRKAMEAKQSFSTVPWWGQARAIVWSLGPVTVAFFMFMAVNWGWLPSPALESSKHSVEILQQNQQIMTDVRQSIVNHSSHVTDTQKALVASLRQICRNTATKESQREKCDDMQP